MEDLGKQLQKAMNAIMQDIADQIEKDAKSNIRLMGIEDTGSLKDSIKQKHNADGSIEVGSELPYAEAVHQGSGKGRRTPHPFLLSAVRKVVNENREGS